MTDYTVWEGTASEFANASRVPGRHYYVLDGADVYHYFVNNSGSTKLVNSKVFGDLDIAEATLAQEKAKVETLETKIADAEQRLDGLDNTVATGVITYDTVADLPATDGSGRTAYVENDGYYADKPAPDGWTKVFGTLPADFEPRVTSVEQKVAEVSDVVSKALLRSVSDYALTTRVYGGAVFWDGVNSGGNLTSATGGFLLPAGEQSTDGQFVTGYTHEWLISEEFAQKHENEEVAFGFLLKVVPDINAKATQDNILRLRGAFHRITDRSGNNTTLSGNASSEDYYSADEIEPGVLDVRVKRTVQITDARLRLDYGFSSHAPFADDIGCVYLSSYVITEETDTVATQVANAISASSVMLSNIERVVEYSANAKTGSTFRSSVLSTQAGIDVAIGATGEQDFINASIPLLTTAVGSKVRFEITADTSANFTNESPLSTAVFVRNAQGAVRNNAAQVSTTIEGDYIKYVIELVREPDDVYITVSPKIVGGQVRSTKGFMEWRDVTYRCLSAPVGYTANGVATEYAQQVALLLERRGSAYKRITVNPRGNGADYTSINLAENAEGGGQGPSARLLYTLSHGSYDGSIEIPSDDFLLPKDFTEIRGESSRSTVFDFVFPAGTPDQSKLHGVYIQNSFDRGRYFVKARNVRYGEHDDAGGRGQGEHATGRGIRIWHMGADGWPSPSAYGAGGHSGYTREWFGYDLQSSTQGAGIHDAPDMDDGMNLRWRASYLMASKNGQALGVSTLGGGVTSDLELSGTSLGGVLNLSLGLSLSKNPKTYQSRGTTVEVYNETRPVAWISEANRDSLILESGSTGGAFLKLDGELYDILFQGAAPREGGGGLSARVVSHEAIALAANEPQVSSNITRPDLSLANRLKDLSSNPKSMSIEYEGGSSSLTANIDFAGMDNDAVIAHFQTLLPPGLNISKGQPFKNRAVVQQPDGEKTAENLDNVYIRKGEPVTRVDGGVRRMQAGDDIYRVGGVSMCDSIPAHNDVSGERNIYQWRGDIAAGQLLGLPAQVLVFGDLLEPVPGGYVKTADRSRALLEVVQRHDTNPDATICTFLVQPGGLS